VAPQSLGRATGAVVMAGVVITGTTVVIHRSCGSSSGGSGAQVVGTRARTGAVLRAVY